MAKKTQRMKEIESEIGEPVELYLRREYQENVRSGLEIGNSLGINSTTVSKWLRRFNIQERTQEEAAQIREMNKRGKLKPSKETLKDLYHSRGMNSYQIAEDFGVTPTIVCRWMNNYGIERRKGIEALKGEDIQASERELSKLYYDERLSMEEIGKRFGVSQRTVGNWMDNYGLERRDSSDARLILSGKKKLSEEEIREALEKFGSIKAVVRALDINRTTLKKGIRDYGIDVFAITNQRNRFVGFIRANVSARNLAAASLMLNGDASDLEQVLLNAYQGRFSDQKQLHDLINQNKDEIYEAVQDGLTNLGEYIGEFTLQDRAIIPVLIGQAIGEMQQSDLTSSVKDKLVRIFRSSYGPRFNDNPRGIIGELEKSVESSDGAVREIYEDLHRHYQDTLALQEDLK